MAWLIHWVTFGIDICIHGSRFCTASIGGSPHSWGSIQVCCIFHPCGGYHYHWIEIVSCKWLRKPTITCGRTTWTFCFFRALGQRHKILHLCFKWTYNIFDCKYFSYIMDRFQVLICPWLHPNTHKNKHQHAKERVRSITLTHCP
jgi:hypothetical protein